MISSAKFKIKYPISVDSDLDISDFGTNFSKPTIEDGGQTAQSNRLRRRIFLLLDRLSAQSILLLLRWHISSNKSSSNQSMMFYYYGGFVHGRTGCVVYGLPSGSTDESLRRAFSPFGVVVRAMIAFSRRTNQDIGTVVFEDDASAREAVKRMNLEEIDGHQITVKESRFPEFPRTDPLSPEDYARLGRLGCVVYGLPSGTTDESLRRAFSPFGKVVRAMIGLTRPTNQNIGTVVFEDETSARKAVERMNLAEIDGHQITVKESRFPEFPPGSSPRPDYHKASTSASDSGDFGPLGCVVDGLGSGATDESFTRAFSQFGDVIHARIGRDAGCGKKLGMVVYEDERSAREAIEKMNGKEIDGYRITVKESRFRQFRRRAVVE